MSDFQIFIKFNNKSHVFWVNHGTNINKLSKDIAIKFNMPYNIEYCKKDPDKILNIETPFYIICNSKVLDRCNFKTLNDFNIHWPCYRLQKDCTLWVHTIHTSKLWDKYKVSNNLDVSGIKLNKYHESLYHVNKNSGFNFIN